jgi:PAS domain S-box-containing protein
MSGEQKQDDLATAEHEGALASERRYHRLFETARDGILILDGASGKITEVNPFMMDLLGYSREEFLGKELWEIGLFKDSQASQDTFRELQKKGYIRYDNLPLESKHGDRREVEFISNVYAEGGRQIIQCNVRDITVRRGGSNSGSSFQIVVSRREHTVGSH